MDNFTEPYIKEYICGEKYGKCSNGLLLPLFEECHWSRDVRATLYFFGLLYCFLGVAIIADVFMGAIEKITSKTRKIYLASPKDDQPEVYEVRVWSDAVANLTLMALGSSAPEILLSIIEIAGNDFHAGDLGPGTIVGSAAFNLFIITAICVVSIPNGETRRIKDLKVFSVTAIFSIIAYIWLLLIVTVITPDVVDIWEAAITLLLFPVLVLVAWLVEKNICGVPKSVEPKTIELGNVQPGDNLLGGKQYFPDGKLDREGLVHFIKEVKRYPGLTDEDAAILAATKLVESKPHSRMWYRVGAIRNMTGGRKCVPQMSMKLKQVYNALNEHPQAPTLGDVPIVKPEMNAIIDFHTGSCAVLESVGKFSVFVNRSGRTDNSVKVRVESIDGTAVVDEDYVKVNEVLTFEPGETEKEVVVEIIDDNVWEPDEEFFLKVSLMYDESRVGIQLGRISIMQITILNDDEPGTLMFERRGLLVKESVGNVIIPVIRRNGADGEVSVKWKTVDKSAVSGKDYQGGEGTLTFKHTETTQDIIIPIVDDMTPEKDEHFEVHLIEATGGAKIGQISRTAVTIINDDSFDSVLSQMMLMTNANLHKMQVHHETYLTQLKDAMNVNGGDIENATMTDYAMHFLTFGWKIVFALVPPPSMLGGWLCFIVSLGMIGFLTAIIGDLAGMFGCMINLKNYVTAITLVALGTSMPDTFASKTAAIQEKYADNAIGNITGSNSVNVFLGLGLPWLIAALVHHSRDQSFLVSSDGLGFSVGVFMGHSLLCLGLLVLRRFLKVTGNAELGGPVVAKYVTGIIMILLWVAYVLISIARVYGVI